MTTDTSYNPNFAPYVKWAVPQAPVPASVHNLPGTIPASGNVQSSLILTEGFSLISVGITTSQAGTLSVQRYLDAGGVVVQGAASSVALSAGIAANLNIMDGKPFASFIITITNSAGSVSTISNLAVLAQVGENISSGNTGVDGSTTITTGGTAQNLFAGATPTNGFGIYNPDPVNDLWISDSTTAVANGTGSIRVAANGGGYETPAGYKPIGAVSVVGAVTSQKITARRW
ncbi:MAG: hypothetical protein WCD70_14170 [Alphaproteobacteria bacterium]